MAKELIIFNTIRTQSLSKGTSHIARTATPKWSLSLSKLWSLSLSKLWSLSLSKLWSLSLSKRRLQPILFLMLFLVTFPGFAQKSLKMVREGNKYYNKGEYKEAEINYRKAITENAADYKAQFNLGDAMYKQKNFDEAARIFENVAKSDAPKDVVSQAYHNLGNTLLQQKKYEESIEAYKNALRKNPDDMDTKYNLEYAKKMLKQQQQQQQQQQNEQQQNEQQQDKDKQEEKNKDQQNKNDQNKDQQDKEKNKQQQQGQISKEDAERMLNALMNQEKNTREKLDKEKENGTKTNIEKNW